MSSWIHALQAAAGWVTAGSLLLFLVRLTLIAGAGRIAVALLPRASAASRHLVATFTLAALVALPLATAVLPAWQLPILPHREVVENHSPALQVTTAETFVKRTYDSFDGEEPYGATAPTTERLAAPRLQPEPIRLPTFPRLPNSWPLLLVILALAASEALLLRLVVSLAAAAVIARSAQPVSDLRVLRVFDAARERLGIRTAVDLRTTPRVSVPVVSGVISPTLLLPAGAEAWEADRLQVVFLHELAHVQRYDTAFLVLARAAGAFYWFHPYVRALVRDARRECEQACDDRVLRSGIRASVYADHLLTIARNAAARDGLGGAVLAIARQSNLEQRLSSILCLGVERSPASRRSVWVVSLLTLLLLLPLASVRVTSAAAPRTGKRHPVAMAWKALTAVSPVTVAPSVPSIPSLSELSSPSDVALPTSVPPTEAPATPPTPPTLATPTLSAEDPANPDVQLAGNDYGRSEKDVAQREFSRAKRYYDREHYGEAAQAYEQAARAGYNIETAYYNAACSYALDHQRERALAMLSAAVESGWDDADKIESDEDFDSIHDDTRFRRIVSQVRSIDPEESKKKSANAEYQTLRSRTSNDPDAWGDAGVSLMRSGDHDRAVEAFENQIRLGGSSNAVYNLACAHALNGDKAEALSTLERAIYAGFSSADHMRDDDDLANLHGEPRFRELVRLCESLELNPDGLDEDDRSGWREALPQFERVARAHPNAGRAWFNLGYAQLRARDNDGSRASFERALDLKYRPATTMYNLACVAAQDHDFDTAMSWLDRSEAAGMKLENYVGGDQDLDPLRADARYRALLHRMGDRQWDKVRSKLKKL